MRNSVILLALLIASPALAQRDLATIPDPDPEVERRSFLVDPGFEVNLFAADPLLAKPIQMNFDARGRLWVASSEVYPQIQPGQAASDKILVLEDKDGDGAADSTTIFADGLLIPTGVEPGDGGAYVANSTELLFLKDTDGDGKADSRRVILSGFGTEDTHHILHTLRWGEDGMLYCDQSIYIHSHIETPHGPRRLNGGGTWQFRPETMELNVFARGLVNPWGLAWDRWGATFATDGAGGEGINYLVPGAYYVTSPDAVRILPGLNPGSPKYCGLEVVSGRHLPDDWQGNLITNDFRANRVCRFVLSEDGSGFASREQPELIKTTHGAFRPIDVKTGPDGAIYIADWYNPIIQHGEVDFRDPRRDHTHGRIWRVTAKGRPLVDRPNLADAPIPAILEALRAPEDSTRHFAKRVLKERGAAEVLPHLASWTKGLDPESANFEHDRLEALWTYQSLDVPEPDLLAATLDSPDPQVRAASCRIAPHWQDRISDMVALLAPRVEDEHPRVRLEAVRALGQSNDPRAIEVALRALDRPVDKWLDYALWLTARDLQPKWLPELQAGKLDFGGDTHKLAFALGATGSVEVVGPLLRAFLAGKIGGAQHDATLRLLATLGSPKELGALFDVAVAEGTPINSRASLLTPLIEGTQARNVRPDGDLDRLGELLTPLGAGSLDDGSARVAAIRAIGAWKVVTLRDRLLAIEAGSLSPTSYRDYVEALAELGGETSRDALERASRRESPLARRAIATVALSTLDPKAAAGSAIMLLRERDVTDLSPEAATEMISGLLQRKGGSPSLAGAVAALPAGHLSADVAKLGVRAARASGREESALIDAFSKAGKLATGPVALTAAEMDAMIAEVRSQGEPSRGEAIFRRTEMQCLNCHAIAGAGGQVGPGLESIGASAPTDYLIDSLLQPNKAVKEGYHAVTIATDDGRVLTGVKLQENDRETRIREAEGRELTIPTASIEEKKEAGSLMPAGLTETLTRGEFLDLVRFLSELGKVGSYSVSKARLVRTWQVLASARPESVADWTPLYGQVDGSVPIAELSAIGEARGAVVPIRFGLDVTTPGDVRFLLNSTAGITEIRIGRTTFPVASEIVANLNQGRQTFLLMLDPKAREEGLRCEIADVPGSKARVQAVLGK